MTLTDAEPDLPRTQDPAISAPAIEVSDLPGPLSRDDDEDSSPRPQDLYLAEHTSCSNHGLTTLGQESTALTHQGLLDGNPTTCKDPPGSANLTGSTSKGHPVTANLSDTNRQGPLGSANLSQSQITSF